MELPEVILVPGNPLDVRPEHLRPLATKIQSAHGLRVDVAVVPLRGYGVTWWEVLLIYVGTKGADAATGHAFQLLLDSVTDALARSNASCEKAGGRRRAAQVLSALGMAAVTAQHAGAVSLRPRRRPHPGAPGSSCAHVAACMRISHGGDAVSRTCCAFRP